MPRLNEAQRNKAIGRVEAGETRSDVAMFFNVSPSTISRLWARYQQHGSTRDLPITGRPRVTTATLHRYIRLQHLCQRTTTAASTASTIPGHRRISDLTVRNRLREAGLRSRRPVRGVILTRNHLLQVAPSELEELDSDLHVIRKPMETADSTDNIMKDSGQRLILGDSLSRGIRGSIPNCQVHALPGATLKKMNVLLESVCLRNYHVILLHVGTNDISSSVHSFQAEYFNLIRSMKSRNPNAVIICCDIIPRTKDFSETQGVVIRANNIIRHVCTVLKCKYVRTSKRFLYLGTGAPRHYLYCPDGLHLNDKGKYQLKRSFAQALSHAYR
ncbi:uncharacterized protein [Haliotis asinina]|uniref:uncharacterized protein n=1 Tax=Haliotis asinina TaxID=109174 RepID=UPI0035324820